MDSAASEPRSLFARQLLPIMLATLTTVSLAAFDGISVVVALPAITADLGSADLLPWVITAFLLASAIATLASGPAIDTIGLQQSFRITVVAFAATSAACAFAPTMEVLVFFRVLQGLGGGLATALALAAVGISVPTALRARAYVANSMVWGGFALAGPVIASVLTETIGWRSIFLVNVPLCALALIVGWSGFSHHVVEPSDRRFDYLGLGLLAGFTTVILLGVSRFDLWTIAALATAAILGSLYWHHSGRIPNPVLERRFFAYMPFVAINLIGAGAFGAGTAITSYYPVFVEGALGRGAGAVSFGMLAFSAGWLSGSLIASRVIERLQSITTATIGVTVAAVATAAGVAIVTADPPTWLIALVLYGVGTGIGVISPSMLMLLQGRTAKAAIGRATAAHQYMRTLGLTFATGLMGAVLLTVVRVQTGDTSVVEQLLAGDDVDTDRAAQDALADGFRGVVAVAFVVVALTFIGLAVLRRWNRSDAAVLEVAPVQPEGSS